MVKEKHGRYKHGDADTKLYKTWCNMKSRCNNKNNKDYHRYGGRNITVCKDWGSYEKFKEWAMNNGYKEGLTIDRIDNNGDYSPINCQWTTMKEQSINKENTLIINFKGEKRYISELAEELNLSKSTVWYRNKNNIPIDLDRNIEQLNNQGHVIQRYSNIEKAIKETGFTSIRKVFQGKCKTAGGYYWRHARQDGTADTDKGYI